MDYGLFTVITLVFGGATDQQIWTAERSRCSNTWRISNPGYHCIGGNVSLHETETTNSAFFTLLLQYDGSVLLRLADCTGIYLGISSLTHNLTLIEISEPTQILAWSIILTEFDKFGSKRSSDLRSIRDRRIYDVEVYERFGTRKWTFGYSEPYSPISIQQTGIPHIWWLVFDQNGWSFQHQDLYASWIDSKSEFVVLDTNQSAESTRHFKAIGYGSPHLKADGHGDYLSVGEYHNLNLRSDKHAKLWDIVLMDIEY